MIRHIDSAWKAELQQFNKTDTRVYIDPRGKEYAPLIGHNIDYVQPTSKRNWCGSHAAFIASSGTYTYDLVSYDTWDGGSAANTGSDTWDGGTSASIGDDTWDGAESVARGEITLSANVTPSYLCTMPETFTLRLVVYPNHAHDTASDRVYWVWRVSGTQFFEVRFDATDDKFTALWYDGTAERELQSQQFDDGASFEDLDQELTIDMAIDLSTGSTAGSQLWVNRTSRDTTWTGNIDAKSTNQPLLNIGHRVGSNIAESEFRYAILIPDYVATDTDVQNDYNNVTNESIVWDFNGEGTGRTRCNVTSYVRQLSWNKSQRKKTSGSQGTNEFSMQLLNNDGAFNDDENATFDPTSSDAGRYNGTDSENFLQRRFRVWAENVNSDGDREILFAGRVTDDGLQRSSSPQGTTTVELGAEDLVADIGRRILRRGRKFEDHLLCDPTDESNSLFHKIARLATEREIRNYLGNSSFDNATISNSWGSTGLTLSRSTSEAFLGSASAKLDATVTTGSIQQTVTFKSNTSLNREEAWTFQVYLLSASTCSANIELEERTGGVLKKQSTETYSVSGGEHWQRFDVQHEVSDSTSNELVVVINVDDAVVLYADAAMLVRNDRAHDWYVENTTDGSSGEISADNNASDGYDSVGFDVEPVDITHPWAVVEKGEQVWEYLKRLADASVSHYLGMDAAGTLRLRVQLGAYGEPESFGTIDDAQSVEISAPTDNANKIVIRGVRITKQSREKLVWQAAATEDFDAHTSGSIAVTLQDGDGWPPKSEFGRYFAVYGDPGWKGDLPWGLRNSLRFIPEPPYQSEWVLFRGM